MVLLSGETLSGSRMDPAVFSVGVDALCTPPLLDNAIDCLSSDLRLAVQLEFACVLRGADSRESLTIEALQDFKATSVIMLGHPGIGETPPILDVRLRH